MSRGPEEQIEHAEHAWHATHSPFDRRVAMTMAIVAAALAGVTMLSHRAHNETLRLQGEANRAQTEADILHTRATDTWNHFQAKNIRNQESQALLDLLPLLGGASPDRERVRSVNAQKIEKYKKELPALQNQAEELEREAADRQTYGGQRIEESERYHRRGNWFDLSELAVELALVLCSVAVLTKEPRFWYGGIVAGGVGVAIALGGLLA